MNAINSRIVTIMNKAKSRILLFGLIIIGSILSCSKDDRLAVDQYPQIWKLTEMSGSIADVPPTTGNDMAWQEYYLLNSDSTFVKVRERDSIVKEGTGTFTFINLSDGKYLELIYASDNDLIGNCTEDPIELLRLNSDNKLIGTWWACDGPGLVYEKAELGLP